MSPVPNPPTTRGAAGVLGEAQAMAPQVAFSVYSVSVVYLRRMLIFGFIPLRVFSLLEDHWYSAPGRGLITW